MDDLCVHCGEPIIYVPLARDAWTVGRGAWLHRLGGRTCPNTSGHHACPAQSGFE